MSESVAISLKRAAVLLAEELEYERAAEKMNISTAELRQQIAALETQLCLHIFAPERKRIELTEEGQFLIRAFRESIARHDRSATRDVEGNPITRTGSRAPRCEG